MNTQKRGLGPITGPEDYDRAVREMRDLARTTTALPAEVNDYMVALTGVVNEYHQFSFGSAKALPQKMLQYLLEVARNVTLEDAEAATGTTNLQGFMAKHRDLDANERCKLAQFFGVSEDVFVNTNEQ